jgi:signal transduction histidine kinase
LKLGVRARTTLIATAVVGLMLIAAGVLLLIATRSALYRSVETSATARAADLASQLARAPTPRPIPLVGGITAQVVVNGAVVSSTADIEGQAAIVDLAATPGMLSTIQVTSLDANENQDQPGQDEGEGPFLVAATGVSIDGAQSTVLAAASLEPVSNATTTLLPLLAIGVPAITLLVGFIVWRLTGRAFRPVLAMAQEADAISYSDLHRRVTEPQPDDEIRRLSLMLNRMLGRLEAAVSRQRRLTADAGHELRSPVASLLTMAEVAEANPESISMTEFAADVAEQSRRLATLVDDLLVLARSDEHRLELTKAWFDLTAVTGDELALRAAMPVSFHLEANGPAVVFADRHRTEQVVRNLLDNAQHHASNTVRVAIDATANEVEMRVADDGPGIPPDDRQRVFERFVRLDKSRSRAAGGTGLGLAVVRSIIEAHGGRVTVDNDPILGGAVFTFVLPTNPSASVR